CLASGLVIIYFVGLSYLTAAAAFLVSVGGVWSVLAGLLVRDRRQEGGQVLERSAQPPLYACPREVATATGVPVPDRVVLRHDDGVSVHESGRPIQVLRGRGTRVLTLGLAALPGLSETELKAVLAHELGHLAHGETRLGPLLGRLIASQVI